MRCWASNNAAKIHKIRIGRWNRHRSTSKNEYLIGTLFALKSGKSKFIHNLNCSLNPDRSSRPPSRPPTPKRPRFQPASGHRWPPMSNQPDPWPLIIQDWPLTLTAQRWAGRLSEKSLPLQRLPWATIFLLVWCGCASLTPFLMMSGRQNWPLNKRSKKGRFIGLESEYFSSSTLLVHPEKYKTPQNQMIKRGLEYRRPGSNRHECYLIGFWDRRVYRFRHFGMVRFVGLHCQLRLQKYGNFFSPQAWVKKKLIFCLVRSNKIPTFAARKNSKIYYYVRKIRFHFRW